jgi:hypothetical protein
MMRLLAFGLSLLALASAFADDLCAVPRGAAPPGHYNLFQKAFADGCSAAGMSETCLGDVVAVPFAPAFQAPSMNGIFRLEIPPGGFVAHRPTTHAKTRGGYAVDVLDHDGEGFIASMRDWVYSNPGRGDDGEGDGDLSGAGYLPAHPHHDACVAGFTVAHGKTHSHYSGPSCQLEGYVEAVIPVNASASLTITAEEAQRMFGDGKTDPKVFHRTVRQIVGARSYFGPQLLDARTGYTLNQIPLWLRRNAGTSLDAQTGRQVPEQVVKLGVYLNFLADRVSQALCVGAPGTAMTKLRDDPVAYSIEYDAAACSAANVAFNRFAEVGQTNYISEGTLSAISAIWSELNTWAAEMKIRHPSWFSPTLAPSGTMMRTFVADVLRATLQKKAETRLQAFLNLYQKYGFPTLPGYPSYSARCV